MGSFEPNESMIAAGARALEVRAGKPKSQRGMTAVGIRRAGQLKNGEPLGLDTVKRLLGYLSRHLVDKQGATWDEQGKGWQAWHAWGGDAAGPWAARIIRREDPVWWNRWVQRPRNKRLARALGFPAKPVKTPSR